MPAYKPTGHNHSHAPNRYAVLPTAVRLEANPNFSGRDVTIAFLDSGFYPHPDLTHPTNRILAFHDITNPDVKLDPDVVPEGVMWHGTQTSVAAVGNGFLSDGHYRGIASNASVVLVRVSEKGRISEANIARGLRWVIENKDRYNIRVVNISLGGDEDVSYKENIVDLAAEEAVSKGIVVVVAAGNSGNTEDFLTVPPANSPSVITVGGYNDGNEFRNANPDLYWSNYGPTADGILKPEVVAPAIFVAAPILPNTPLYRQAETLAELDATPDFLLAESVRERHADAGLPEGLDIQPPAVIRRTIDEHIQRHKLTAAHYQHVDGTSFAAPIVASVVAQMIEANPKLTPAAIKHILISTARRVRGAALIRQGFGVVNARAAVELAKLDRYAIEEHYFQPPRVEGDRLVFYFHDDLAKTVALAGDFNDWDAAATPFAWQEAGVWRADVTGATPGPYRYKFVVDGTRWVEDPGNGLKEPDGYGGFNSIIVVE